MKTRDKFMVAGIQMDVASRDAERNLGRALHFVDEALEKDAKIICLPELFTTGFDYDYIEEIAETIPNRLTDIIGEKAGESGTYIIAGSMPERRDEGIYNTSVIFGTDGGIIGKYSKMHLFPLMDEDTHFQRGKEAPVFSTEPGRIGIMICYDLRFPETARKLALSGAEMIFMPSEFPYPRLDHWKILIRARAIENLVYFAAVNRVGSDGSFTFFGNTSIIDPWGDIISSSGDEEGIVTAEIDLSEVQRVREKLPCLKEAAL